MAKPLVSVIVPVRNRADLIERCLSSIESQVEVTVECIVVDCLSTDGTSQIVASHVGRIPGWRHIVEDDSGQAEAINKGIALCSGKYVTWLNADDYWEQGFLREATALLDAAPETVLATGITLAERLDGAIVDAYVPKAHSREDLLVRTTSVVQPSSLIRRTALDAAGPLDESLHYVMDYDLFIRLLALGTAVSSPRIWAHFLLDPTTKSGSAGERFMREKWRVLRKHSAPLVTPITWAMCVWWAKRLLKTPVRIAKRWF